MSKQSDDMSSVIKMSASYCPEHNQPYECYCSHEKCDSKIRVCHMCKNDHSDHLKFLTEKKQVVEDLNKGLKRCLDKIEEYDVRSQELIKLMKVASQKTDKDYQAMENRLVERMKEDKDLLERMVVRMKQIATKIKEKQKIKIYFSKLHQNNLVQLRVKLSNIEGMKHFKQKNEKLRELTSKVNSQEMNKLYEEFYTCRKDFNSFLHNNITFKVGQIIALKNSRRVNESKELRRVKDSKQSKRQMNDEKENNKKARKQKQKPKTTLNFGQGIINGIMNLFNF